MAVDEEKYDDMKNALDESSSVNRRFLVSFLLFEVYLLVIVGSTSDMQLLINSNIRLPLANFEIPLFGFYIIAPIFMIAIHFNLLFNLLQHSQKLFSWREKAGSPEQYILLQPFLFNFLIRYNKRGQINYYLLRAILNTLIYFFPLSVFLLTQLTFSKYHSFFMTFWHFVLLQVDVLLLLIYWPRIINPKLRDEQSEKLESLYKEQIHPILSLLWKGTKKIIAPSIPFAVVILGADSLALIRGFGGGIIFVVLSSFVAFTYLLVLAFNWKRIWAENLWKNIWMITWKTILLVPFWSILLFLCKLIKSHKSFIKSFQKKFSFTSFSLANRQKTNLKDIFLLFIVATSFANFLLICSLAVGYFPTNKFFQVIYPSLTITEKTLVAKGPSDTIIRYYLDQKKDKKSDWLKSTQGLNLERRDLRFANFRNSELFKANLTLAQLQGAYLRSAELQEATLWGAQLQGADLGGAQLQEAKLWEAQLQGAALWGAQLQGADLRSAQLQGADLFGAELQEANLWEAELQGATFGSAQLQGADLGKAQLQGADLAGAQLQGANLGGAQLQGADLRRAQLQGADLRRAQLQGADLRRAKLQGTYLRLAQLQGATLWGTQLQGADLKHAKLQGIWGNADLITTINWDELSKKVSIRMGEFAGDAYGVFLGDELSETGSIWMGRLEAWKRGLRLEAWKRNFQRKARKRALQRIESARKRCEKFDKSATSQALSNNINHEQFLAERSKCASVSEYVARGILAQDDKYGSSMHKKLPKQDPYIIKENFLENLRKFILK